MHDETGKAMEVNQQLAPAYVRVNHDRPPRDHVNRTIRVIVNRGTRNRSRVNVMLTEVEARVLMERLQDYFDQVNVTTN